MAEEKRGFFKRLADALFEDVAAPVKPQAPRESEPPPPPPAPSPEPDPRPDFAPDPERPPVVEPLWAQVAAEEEEGEQAPGEGDAAVAPPPTQLHFMSAEEASSRRATFEFRMEEVLNSGKKGSAGKLQLLNLDEIRAKLGDRWEAMAEKARAIADQVIAHRLAPTDVWAPFDDDSYVILFAELTEDQAKLKAAAIAREVRERLFGELDIDDKDWIKAFVSDLSDLVPVDPELGAPTPTADAKPAADKVDGFAPAKAAPTFAVVAAALAQRDDVAPPKETISVAERELRKRMGEVGVAYRPTLLFAKAAVTLYEARVTRLDEWNRLSAGAQAYRDVDPGVVFALDREALQRVCRDLRVFLDAPTKAATLQAPVHIQSILTHTGGKLIDICRELPPPLRRFFLIELCGLQQPGASQHVFDVASALSPFCRGLTARVPVGFHDWERLARNHILSVGVDLDDPEMGEMTPARFSELIAPVAKAAAANKMHAHLYGVRRREILKAARDAGFVSANGPAVAGERAHPDGLRAWGPPAVKRR